MKNISKGHSSDIIRYIFGETSFYSKILKQKARQLSKKYNDVDLAKKFNEMPFRFISLSPMAFYSSMMKDLGKKPDENVLTAIGLSCLAIGTHDDVVDETPNEKRDIASLIYSGNITSLEGIRMLFKKQNVANSLIESINQNHYRQQRVVKLLWEGKKLTKARYLDGIHHIVDFTSIGLIVAITDAGRPDLKNKIMRFSEGYGHATQFIDDLREVDEDAQQGYSSLPLLEGKPYNLTFKLAFESIEKAKKSIKPEWKNVNKIVDNTEEFLKQLEVELNG